MESSESAADGSALFSVPLPSRTDVGWMAISPASDTVSMPYTDVPGPFSYHFTGRRIDGKAAVTEVSIGQKDPDHPAPIRSADLRGAPLGAFADLLKSALKVPADQRFSLLAGQARTHVPKLGRSRSAEHFMQVAWVFRNAQLSGDPAPRKAVRDHWQIGEATAKRWLAEVRRRGYLPAFDPAAPRKEEVHDTAARHARVDSDIEQSVAERFLSTSASQAAETIRDRLFLETLNLLIDDDVPTAVREAALELQHAIEAFAAAE